MEENLSISPKIKSHLGNTKWLVRTVQYIALVLAIAVITTTKKW